jgi:hypothetical protein
MRSPCGVGAVATQAIVNVSYGPKGLELLRQGMAPKDIIKKLKSTEVNSALDEIENNSRSEWLTLIKSQFDLYGTAKKKSNQKGRT